MLFETSVSTSDASQKSKNFRRSLFLISQLAVAHAVKSDSNEIRDETEDEILQTNAIQYKASPSQKSPESGKKNSPGKVANGLNAQLYNLNQGVFSGASKTTYLSDGNSTHSGYLNQTILNSLYNDGGLILELGYAGPGFPSYLELGDYPLSGYFGGSSWETPGSQAVLFPDGQLRYIGPALDGRYADFGDLQELGVNTDQVGIDLPEVVEIEEIETGENSGITSSQLNDMSSQLEKSKEFQILDRKLDQLTLALSKVFLGSAEGGDKGHHSNNNVHIDGFVEGMGELNGKITELVKAVGMVSEQNQVIEAQTSKVLGTSTRTLFEVDAINSKLSEIKKDLASISAHESHIERQQSNNIVRSTRDINEINERITDLLRAVGALSNGSYGNHPSAKLPYRPNSSEELREIRGYMSRMQDSIATISGEVTSFLSVIEKTSLQNIEGINQLRKEFSQFEAFVGEKIAKTDLSEKQDHAETMQLLNQEYAQIGNLGKRVNSLFASLNFALGQLRKVEDKDEDYSKAIKTIGVLLQRLGQTSSTLDKLVKKEMSLINNNRWSNNPNEGSVDSKLVLESLRELGNEVGNLTTQQLELFKKYSSESQNEGYEAVVNRINQLQKIVTQLVSEESNYFKTPNSENYSRELVRDVENLSQNIIHLNSIVKGLVIQQRKLIDYSGSDHQGEGSSETHWNELNANFEKLWRVINMLTTQKNWIKQQTYAISKIDSHVTEIGSKINLLINEQTRLQGIDSTRDKGSRGNLDVTSKLEQLRRTVEQLTRDQRILLGKYKDGKNPEALVRDIQSVNYKLADLGSVVTRLLQEQRILIAKSVLGK
ncbi:hypothetical protein K7432_008920 [Basidiobolus ranarum]|uniref:Uncharacterized protein n=1 Tax=Basidiobolus ranarum TaxID=34480 RepID=A0ABR2VXU6_9FUNG